MDPEKDTQDQENLQTPPGGEVNETPEQAAAIDTQGVPATPAEDQDEIDLLQTQIDREEDPEQKQVLVKQRNAANAKRRIELKEAREARLEAERQAAYERGRADAQRQTAQAAVKPSEPQKLELPPEPKEPDYDDFETETDYQKAMREHHKDLGRWAAKCELLTADHERKVQAQQQEIQQKTQSFVSWQEKAQAKHADFMQLMGKIPLNDATLDALLDSEDGIEVAYHLGKNPAEARRLFGLSPAAMLREIGRIEGRLATQSATVPQKNITNAPEPFKPVKGQEAPVTEPTDPERWHEAERERVRKLGRPY